MRKAIVVGLALLLAHPAVAALSDAERHRLAAFVSYVVTTAPSEGGSSDTVKVGDWCPDCTPGGKPLYPSKPGMVGDGSVFEKCGRCGGTQKVQPNDPDLGGMESFGCEICEAFDTDVCDCGNCDGNCGGGCCDNCTCPTPERDELFDNLDNPPARFNESYVKELEYDLQKALEEVQTLKATCPDCPTCAGPEPAETPEEKPEPEESSSKTVTVYRMKGSTWNWEGRSNPSTEFMRQHLKEEHGIDASLMDRKAMQAIHDNCHNYGDDKAFGFPTEYNSSMTSNCPSGTCPLPGSSGSGSCPTCPGGSSSRSYSRGFFGRRR